MHKRFLQRLVTCRQQQLSASGFKTLADLEKYAEESMSPVLYLLLQSAGSADVKVDHAASHLGKALGISNALRSLARARSPSELSIPQDMLVKHSVSQESLLRGAATAPGLRDAVFDVAACAKQHLDKARSLSSDVPTHLRVLFLPALPVARYLELLRTTDFNPYDPKLQRRSGTLPLSMWWSRLRKQY
ncbi:hypothetical protein B566_EDAN013651 [Ephemera danica]|nr:hypothetical protein B566_EDAN013651 [Ephemera danica]